MKNMFDNLSTETIMNILDEAGQVPSRSNGPTIKDTGVPRGKGAKPVRGNYVPARGEHDRVIPSNGDVKDFLNHGASRDIPPQVKKSKYMLEDDDYEEYYDYDYVEEDDSYSDYDEYDYVEEDDSYSDYDEYDYVEEDDSFADYDEYEYTEEEFNDAVDSTLDEVFEEAALILEGKNCSGKNCEKMEESKCPNCGKKKCICEKAEESKCPECGKEDCICSKKSKKPVEPDEIDTDSDELSEDFDLDYEYDSLMEEELEEEANELRIIDEELEELESFLNEDC